MGFKNKMKCSGQWLALTYVAIEVSAIRIKLSYTSAVQE